MRGPYRSKNVVHAASSPRFKRRLRCSSSESEVITTSRLPFQSRASNRQTSMSERRRSQQRVPAEIGNPPSPYLRGRRNRVAKSPKIPRSSKKPAILLCLSALIRVHSRFQPVLILAHPRYPRFQTAIPPHHIKPHLLNREFTESARIVATETDHNAPCRETRKPSRLGEDQFPSVLIRVHSRPSAVPPCDSALTSCVNCGRVESGRFGGEPHRPQSR